MLRLYLNYVDKFKIYPSIKSIRTVELNFNATTVDQINEIIRRLDTKKTIGPDEIPVKVVQMLAYIINKDLTNIINHDLWRNSFSNTQKLA